MEQKNKSENNRYLNLIEHAADGIAIIQAGYFRLVNSALARISGYAKAELEGMPFIDLIAPDERHSVYEMYQDRMKGKAIPSTYEIKGLRRDGQIRHIEVNASLIDFDGKPADEVIIRDITDFRRTNEALRRRLDIEQTASRICTRFLVAGYSDAAVNDSLADLGKITGASRAYLFLFSKNGCYLDNTHEWCAPGVTPQIGNLQHRRCEPFRWWLGFLSRGETIQVKDIAMMPPEASAEKELLMAQDIKSLLVLPVNVSRKLAGFIGLDNVVEPGSWDEEDQIILQITAAIFGSALEHRNAEAKERELKNEVNNSRRLASIGEMASGIAHEINNPLTSIIGFTCLLKQRELPDEVRSDLNVIEVEARRIARIVSGMLTFGRRNAAGKAPTDINELIDEILDQRAPGMASQNIRAETDLATDLPRVLADAAKLKQAFVNIMLNAEQEVCEAHQGGTLTIATARVGSRVQIAFSDDGRGIKPEHLDKIFEPFFTTREVGKGTGLGLSICHGIVRAHRGKISARSEYGKGAMIIIELPAMQKTPKKRGDFRPPSLARQARD